MNSTLKPGVSTGTMKQVMPSAVARPARGAGEDVVVGGGVHAGVPTLRPVDDPLVAVAVGVGLHPGGIRAVQRLGESEADAGLALQHLRDPLGLLLVGPVELHHQHRREVADDRALVLEIVVKAEALGRQVLADDGHAEVRSIAARRTWPAGGSEGSPAASARRRISRSRSSHSAFGQPSRSKSVRAYSRRWSKKRMLSSSRSSGLISSSMN